MEAAQYLLQHDGYRQRDTVLPDLPIILKLDDESKILTRYLMT